MNGPATTPGGSRDSFGLLVFLGGILATIALVAAIVLLWPSGDRDTDVAVGPDTTITTGERGPGTTSADGGGSDPEVTTSEPTPPAVTPTNLFDSGAAEVVAQIAAEAGSPVEVIEIDIYDTYAFLAYRDPANPANIDRRAWRDGDVGEAAANPIDDRVDADSTPLLFALAKLNLDGLPDLTADAPSHFEVDVEVTHVIIDRFLPFDQRVLIRVYASPADGRSGGGYVQYTVAGELVKVIQ